MASKTYAELAVATDVQGGDLLASFRGIGPLKSVTAAVAKTYFTGGTFPADGSEPMTGTMKGYVGSESLPGYTFDGDTDTGLYRVGANSLGVATGGVNRATFDANGITSTQGFIGNLTGSVTGNAATATKWATARNLSLTGDGTATLASVDGSAAVSAALTLATVNANVGSFGSASAVATFTVNAKGLLTAAGQAAISITDANLSSQVTVPKGGTGAVSLTNHGVVLGQGTSAVAVTAAGTTGHPLVSGGASADPAFALLGVVGGGTGAATFTDGGVLIGNGTGAVQVTSAGTAGQVLTSNGTGVDPTFQTQTNIAYTQIGSPTVVSSPVAAVTFTSIPATYNDLFLQMEGVSHSSGSSFATLFAVSIDNGSNWSNGMPLSDAVAGSASLYGATRISGYRLDQGLISSAMNTISPAPRIEGNTSAIQISGVFVAGGVINAIKVYYSSANVDAGTFTLYGV